MNRRFPLDFWHGRVAVRGDAAHDLSRAGLWSVDAVAGAPAFEFGADSPDDDSSDRIPRTDSFGRPLGLYLPEHYEANYPYPLIVWLHRDGGNERELLTALPMISRRNYIGVSFRAQAPAGTPGAYRWSSDEDALAEFEAGLYETVCELRREFHVHSERVILAGFDKGARVGLDLFLRQPQRYGGAVCLAGRFPETRGALSRFRDLRGRRVLVACGSRDKVSTPADNIQAGRLLHAAGMSVSTRIVDAGHEVTRSMLRQIDHWIMDGIAASYQMS